jgi:hypothetical protein
VRSLYQRHNPLLSLVPNLSSRRNSQLLAKAYADFKRELGERFLRAPVAQSG